MLILVCVPQLIQSEQTATVMSSVPISYGGLSLVLNGIALLCHFRTSSGNFKENLQVLLGKQIIEWPEHHYRFGIKFVSILLKD